MRKAILAAMVTSLALAALEPDARVTARTQDSITLTLNLPLENAIWADTVTFSVDTPSVTHITQTRITETSERYDTSRAKTRAALSGTSQYTLVLHGTLPPLSHLHVLYLTTEYAPEHRRIPIP